MPLDDLPGALVVPTWDQIRDRYIRDVRIRNPEAVVIEGTKEFADACVFADQMIAVFYDAKTIGDFVADVNKTGSALDTALARAGTHRFPEAGGSGFVKIRASVGGTTIPLESEIKDLVTGYRFKTTQQRLYTDGELVPITGEDTGPLTNLDAGTVLQWTSPAPGLGPRATVEAQIDGSGLSGGRNAETDGEAYDRLVSIRAKPPATGNDAEYQKVGGETPGITIQQIFTWSCIRGPGSIGVGATLRPGTPGASRIPNGAQLGSIYAHLVGVEAVDDGVYLILFVAQPIEVVYRVTWATGAKNWVDPSPWPPYQTNAVKVDASVTPTATSFRLTTTTAATTAPQIGQTIGVYDQPKAVFRRKRILTVTTIVAGKSWDIAVDQSNDASDTGYAPVDGQTVSPWSESLAALVAPTVAYFDVTGPGEMVDPLPDPGLRMRRNPPNPTFYASSITNRITTPLFALPAVGDVGLASPTIPFAPTTGTVAVFANLLSLGSIAAFPQ